MKFNVCLYIIIWILCIGFNLLAYLWPVFDINVTMLLKETLDSSPLIDFDLNENETINRNEKLRLRFFLWPGRSYSYVDDTEGEDDYSLSNTIHVQLNDPQYIYKIYGQFLDYRKYKTYEELLNSGNIIKKNEKCKEGFTNCGIIDTLDQQLCLPENVNCPINDIEILDINETELIKDYEDKGYNSTLGSNNKIFLYSNNQTDKPIIGRILLSAEQPCANPTEISWESLEHYEDFYTTVCKNKYKGNLHDETYTQFGNITYATLYFENLKNYNEFAVIGYYTHYLNIYKNKFIGMDRKCLKNSNIKDIPETLDMLDILNGIKYSSLGFGILNLAIIFILLISVCRGYLYNRDEEDDCAIDIPEKIYMVFNSPPFMINLLAIIYFMERTPNFDCSDEVVNDQVKLLNRSILVMKISTFGYNILFVIFFAIASSRKVYHYLYERNIFKDYFNL